MQVRNRRIMVVILIAGLSLAACTQSSDTRSDNDAQVEPVQGTDLNRVKLSAKAVERLGLKTDRVRDAQVLRKRMVGGEIMALPVASAMSTESASPMVAASGDASTPTPRPQPAEGGVQVAKAGQAPSKVADLSGVQVRVPLSRDDLSKVAPDQPVRVLPLARDNEAISLTAQPAEALPASAPKDTTAALYYVIDGPEHVFVPGQRVRVELPLAGNETQQTAIPYAAVIYDLQGNTWTYTNPDPLSFVRHRIHVDYVEGDLAVLSQGPPSGTAVVTAGASELFGVELEMGKR